MDQDNQKKFPEASYECVSDKTVDRLDILMKLNGIREKAVLGRKVGLSREYISLLMNKKLKPTLGQAQMITSAFKLQIWDIFDLGDIRDIDFVPANKIKRDEDG